MPLFLQEGATLVAGDTGPDNVKIHNLDSVQLPDLEEMNEAHHAGGTIGEVEWGNLGMKAISPTFKLKGWDPQVMSLLGQRNRQTFTVRGSIKDKQKQTLIGVRAIFFARLGKISPEAFERGKLMGHDHTLHEVTHYQLFFNEAEKYYWDHWEVAFRIDGVDMLADERRILGLPGV
jgi:P2 family phage contractile tail tube protein